jgi:hypothetical protein
MSLMARLDWQSVRRHYDDRVKESKNLRDYFAAKNIADFVDLALGMNGKPAGNYSAAEHNLGPRILASNVNALGRVYDLAVKFFPLKDAVIVPDLVWRAQLKYLQIGVGSEISCMVNPEVCWVCNTRTIWMHLASTQSPGEAEEALQLFRAGDADSQMAYTSWADAFHPELRTSLVDIAEKGRALSSQAGISPGKISYLWADAIASAVYDEYHTR